VAAGTTFAGTGPSAFRHDGAGAEARACHTDNTSILYWPSSPTGHGVGPSIGSTHASTVPSRRAALGRIRVQPSRLRRVPRRTQYYRAAGRSISCLQRCACNAARYISGARPTAFSTLRHLRSRTSARRAWPSLRFENVGHWIPGDDLNAELLKFLNAIRP